MSVNYVIHCDRNSYTTMLDYQKIYVYTIICVVFHHKLKFSNLSSLKKSNNGERIGLLSIILAIFFGWNLLYWCLSLRPFPIPYNNTQAQEGCSRCNSPVREKMICLKRAIFAFSLFVNKVYLIIENWKCCGASVAEW
jgi:hypothetical protein